MSRALREGGGEGAGLEIFADCDQRGETRRACTGPGCPKGSGREPICRPPAPRDTPTICDMACTCGVAGQCAERVSLPS